MKLFSLKSVSLVAVVAVLWSFISYLLGGNIAIYMSPSFKFNNIPDLAGKVAIVTGSNAGLGYVSARELAKKGTFSSFITSHFIIMLSSVRSLLNDLFH